MIHEGTTDDPKQAVAICGSIWRRSKGIKDVPPKKQSVNKERIHLNLCAQFRIETNLVNESGDVTNDIERCTIIVGDGVYNNIYFPADELAKSFQTWEGQPINLDHSDDVLNTVGHIKDLQYDSTQKRITAKPVISGYSKSDSALAYVQGRISAGHIPEVSVGVWLDKVLLEEDNEYNASFKAENLEGDHLALVSRGACSPQAGCGIGLSKNEMITIPVELEEINATISIGGNKSTFKIYQSDNENEEIRLKKNILKEKIKLIKGGKK